MKRVLVLALALAAVLAGCGGGGATTPTSDRAGAGAGAGAGAVTVVLNAEIYTVDARRPWVEAFAFDAGGVIVAVGGEAEVLGAAGEAAVVLDLDGAMVLPGFQDPHVHVPEAGINLDMCFLPAGRSLAAYERLAAGCAAEQRGSDWVRAVGPSLFDLRHTRELPIDVLDRAIPDRPALILDDLGHAAWTNTRGLEAAGIAPNDPDPQGGILHRDPASGRLTGLLLENAQQLARNAAVLDDESNYEGLLVALEALARNGITTVSDAGGYWSQNHPAAWQRALAEGTLTVRGLNSLYVYPSLDMGAQLAEFERRFSNDPSSWLQFDTAKIYVDGILDLGTAAMIEPYDVPIDSRFPSGFFYFDPSQLQTYVSELHRIGYRMNFHVIGDAATRAALDAVASIDADPAEVADRRHRTTHNYLVHPDDLHRFGELGVIADFQSGPDSIDLGYHDLLSRFIGQRAFGLIPVRSLLDAGGRVSLSSDWDADPLPPLGTIERAIRRKTNAVPNRKAAIRLVTLDAAHALGHDDRTGSIEVGKQADFVVLERNLFDIRRQRIDETRVLMTVVGGRIVYESDRGG